MTIEKILNRIRNSVSTNINRKTDSSYLTQFFDLIQRIIDISFKENIFLFEDFERIMDNFLFRYNQEEIKDEDIKKFPIVKDFFTAFLNEYYFDSLETPMRFFLMLMNEDDFITLLFSLKYPKDYIPFLDNIPRFIHLVKFNISSLCLNLLNIGYSFEDEFPFCNPKKILIYQVIARHSPSLFVNGILNKYEKKIFNKQLSQKIFREFSEMNSIKYIFLHFYLFSTEGDIDFELTSEERQKLTYYLLSAIERESNITKSELDFLSKIISTIEEGIPDLYKIYKERFLRFGPLIVIFKINLKHGQIVNFFNYCMSITEFKNYFLEKETFSKIEINNDFSSMLYICVLRMHGLLPINFFSSSDLPEAMISRCALNLEKINSVTKVLEPEPFTLLNNVFVLILQREEYLRKLYDTISAT